jgi:hypothetical protein
MGKVASETARQLQSLGAAGDSKMESLAYRLANLSAFQTEYIEYSTNKGYILLFIYEMLHENITLKYREETGAHDATLLSGQEIQKRHNETLAEIVRAWKPTVDKPKDNAKDIKVHLF